MCESTGFGTPKSSWTGPLDQATAYSYTWDEEAVYFGIKVYDDSQQVNDLVLWAGDSINLVITDVEKTQIKQIHWLSIKAGEVCEAEAVTNPLTDCVTGYVRGTPSKPSTTYPKYTRV